MRREKNWLKLIVIFVLSLFVITYCGLLIHEICGHALTAKLLGGRVKKISIGSYWNLLRFKTRKTVWEFNSIPWKALVTYVRPDSKIKGLLITFVGIPLEILFYYLLYKLIKTKEKNLFSEYFVYGKSIFCWTIIILVIISSILYFPFLRRNDFTHIAEVLIYGKRTNSLYLFKF